MSGGDEQPHSSSPQQSPPSNLHPRIPAISTQEAWRERHRGKGSVSEREGGSGGSGKAKATPAGAQGFSLGEKPSNGQSGESVERSSPSRPLSIALPPRSSKTTSARVACASLEVTMARRPLTLRGHLRRRARTRASSSTIDRWPCRFSGYRRPLMAKLAVFYHTRLDGGHPEPLDPLQSFRLLGEVISDLVSSGLYDAAAHITFGVNSSEAKFQLTRSMAPPKVVLHHHSAELQSELPTLALLREWLPEKDDWYVLYLHAKGVRHPHSPITHAWRRCMTRHTVHNWRSCVADLDSGCDSVGAHWLTPQEYPERIRAASYWGGNFWWAKSSFLRTLPELPANATTRAEFYLAESWIGRGPRLPVVRDYAPHWPDLALCTKSDLAPSGY
jgi:hypothetical protein